MYSMYNYKIVSYIIYKLKFADNFLKIIGTDHKIETILY